GIAEGVAFTNAEASKLSGTVANKRTQITVDQTTIERANAKAGTFNAITMRGVSATLAANQSEARGSVEVRDGSWDKSNLGQITGQFVANRDEISLNGFNASAFGGGATGDLRLSLSPGGNSQLQTEFTGLQLVELFSLFGAQNDHLAGTVTG